MSSSETKPHDTEDDIDPEIIQSAVDVSFSLALNMVQNWMPSTSFEPSPSINESRKKLEEYMNRPPRLGVGAPIPQSQGTQPTHHETQKLKNRLVGSGAARRRAENPTSQANGTNHESEEDESESRANVMKKKGKSVNGKPAGLSVFGSTMSTTLKDQPQPQVTITNKNGIPPPSTTVRSSTSPSREAIPDKFISPSSPNQPMEIHTLPPKLSLSAKVWARSNGTSGALSPTGSDRVQTKRRKVAQMLPPPVNPNTTAEVEWNIQLPGSRSSSVSISSSQAQSTDTTAARSANGSERDSDSVAVGHLSRKERKRLRREAAQQSANREKQNVRTACESSTQELLPGFEAQSADQGRDAQVLRTSEAESDESSGSDDESKVVSRIQENGVSGKASENDTVQEEGKRKRKRRAKKKAGPG